MNFDQTEQRRAFIKVAIGLSSASWASWVTASSSSSAQGSPLETQLRSLPHNVEPMVVSGRVTTLQNKPYCGQSVLAGTKPIVTDADGRFWQVTNTTEFKNANMPSSKQIANHQLTQDASGVWRLYLELSA
jgi:hypothetical protein